MAIKLVHTPISESGTRPHISHIISRSVDVTKALTPKASLHALGVEHFKSVQLTPYSQRKIFPKSPKAIKSNSAVY